MRWFARLMKFSAGAEGFAALQAWRDRVAGRESAAKVRDASLPSNQLIGRTAGKAHSQQK